MVTVQSFSRWQECINWYLMWSYWSRLNVCYHVQGLRLRDENLQFWMSPTVEVRQYISSCFCLSKLSAKVMSPCDRSHSHFTYQPLDDGSDIIGKRDDRETARFFFLTVWGKKTTKVFLKKKHLSPELPHIRLSLMNILRAWETSIPFTALLFKISLRAQPAV